MGDGEGEPRSHHLDAGASVRDGHGSGDGGASWSDPGGDGNRVVIRTVDDLIAVCRERLAEWERLALRACARGYGGCNLGACLDSPPDFLERFLGEWARVEAARQIALIQSVNFAVNDTNAANRLINNLSEITNPDGEFD